MTMLSTSTTRGDNWWKFEAGESHLPVHTPHRTAFEIGPGCTFRGVTITVQHPFTDSENDSASQTCPAIIGFPEHSAPMPGNRWVRTPVQPSTDFAIKDVSLPGIHQDVTREGVEEVNILFDRRDALPINVANGDHLEKPARFNLTAVFRQFSGTRPIRGVQTQFVVDRLNLPKKGAPSSGKAWSAVQKARCPLGSIQCHAVAAETKSKYRPALVAIPRTAREQFLHSFPSGSDEIRRPAPPPVRRT